MTQFLRAVPGAALATFALLSLGCLPGGSGDSPEPSPTLQADVQAIRTVTVVTPTATPAPTELPVLPTLTTYTVQSGDYPTLIAENAGVPAAEQDAWIVEMLALNGVDAYSLQIGQQLILPPFGDGTLPTVRANPEPADPPAAVLEPVDTPIPVMSTPKPAVTQAAPGVPFAPTPPFVAFTQPTATPTPTFTPTATRTPTPTATPSPTPTIGAGVRAWLTSSEDTAVYYYCDLDSGWQSIPAESLLAFDSEQQLLSIWGRFRTKAPNSVC